MDAFIIMPNHVHGIIIIDKKRNVVGVIVETRHALSLQSPQTTPPIPPQTSLSNDNLSLGQKRFRNPGKNNISSIIGSYKSVI